MLKTTTNLRTCLKGNIQAYTKLTTCAVDGVM